MKARFFLQGLKDADLQHPGLFDQHRSRITCGQSVSTGSADLALPIPLGPVHCPYCRQEHFYLERDRIEFDTENGLPLIDSA
jgi:hypothetical protein